MSLPQKKHTILPLSQERRRFQRVHVDLLGRYMLADRGEFPCQVVNMSPGGMALVAPVAGKPGERVIAYVDHVGRLEGVIARHFEWLRHDHRGDGAQARQARRPANRGILGLPEDRRHGRIIPRNPMARLILPNGVNISCRVIDISQSGAAVKSDQRPDLGALVTLGKTPSRVVRHIEEGFAVEFIRLQHPDSLEENITGG